MRAMKLVVYLLASALVVAVPLAAQRPSSAASGVPGTPGGILFPAGGDIPKTFSVEASGDDYIKREVMIPMRDGVRLHTVIVIPKGARNAPIVLTRTPYNASKRASRNSSQHMLAALPQGHDVWVGRL